MSKTFIGLDTAKSEELAAKLNKLLATYQFFNTNVLVFTGTLKT